MLENDLLIDIHIYQYNIVVQMITGRRIVTGIVSHRYLVCKLPSGPKYPPPNYIGMPVGSAGILPPFIFPPDPSPPPGC